LVVLSAAGAPAETIHVDQAGGGDYLTIQEGIDAATYGDTVLVLPGVYSERLVMGADKDGITLTSRGGADSTSLSMGGSAGLPLLHIEDVGPATIVSGLTFEDNRAQRPQLGGGGILAEGSGVTIEDCVIQDCYASYHGGGLAIHDPAGTTIRRNVIQRNSAGDGGGMCLWDSGSATVTDNVFRENAVSGWYTVGGGGAHISGAAVTLTGNAFEDNVCLFAGNGGGALLAGSGAVITAESNIFVGNEGSGAVMYLRNVTLHASGNVISGNAPSGACINLSEFLSSPENDVTFADNIIHGNEGPILRVWKNVLPSFVGNSIDPNGYLVLNVSEGAHAGTLDASGNWWGTTDPTEIASLIHDCVDDPAIDSCVDFSDWCTDPSCDGQVTSVEDPPEAAPVSWGRIKSLYR
jgi:nitrous oxidase accessory protein NosD